MNRKGYERLSSHSAPIFLWKVIFISCLLITIVEILSGFYICSHVPEAFILLPNYGSDLETILRCFFFVSFNNNIVCLLMFALARFRSSWSNNGILLKTFVIWFAFQAYAFIVATAFHCWAYNSLESSFEHYDFRKLLDRYKDDVISRTIINKMQVEMKCCGINSPSDWLGIRWWVELTDLDEYRFKVPKSCCRVKKCVYAAKHISQLTIRDHGCYNLLMNDLERRLFWKSVLFVMLSLLHFAHFLSIFSSLPKMERINLTYDEFVTSKRLFTVLYHKKLMEKLNEKLGDLRPQSEGNYKDLMEHKKYLESELEKSLEDVEYEGYREVEKFDVEM